jgi:DNA polymerase-3 subunit delta'
VLLDSLLAQVSRGQGLDPLAAAASLDKLVKAEKRPAPLKRVDRLGAEVAVRPQSWRAKGLPPRYFLPQTPLLQGLAQTTDTFASSWHCNRKAIQYKAQCEQPLNSRLFLEEFFLSYVTAVPNLLRRIWQTQTPASQCSLRSAAPERIVAEH